MRTPGLETPENSLKRLVTRENKILKKFQFCFSKTSFRAPMFSVTFPTLKMSDTENNMNSPLLDNQHVSHLPSYSKQEKPYKTGTIIYSIFTLFTFSYLSFEMLKFDFICSFYDPFELNITFLPNIYGTLPFSLRMVCLVGTTFITMSSVSWILGALTEIRILLWPMKFAQCLIIAFSVALFTLWIVVFVQVLESPYGTKTTFKIDPVLEIESGCTRLDIQNHGTNSVAKRTFEVCYYPSRNCDMLKISEFKLGVFENRYGTYFQFLAVIFGQFIISFLLFSVLANMRYFYRKLQESAGQTRAYSYDSIRGL